MLPNPTQRRNAEEPNALHRLCQHPCPAPGPMLVPKLAPVHGAAVWADDLAIDSQRRVALDLGDAGNKRKNAEILRKRPEDVEIRVRGQIGQARLMLPNEAAEGRGLHNDPLA